MAGNDLDAPLLPRGRDDRPQSLRDSVFQSLAASVLRPDHPPCPVAVACRATAQALSHYFAPRPQRGLAAARRRHSRRLRRAHMRSRCGSSVVDRPPGGGGGRGRRASDDASSRRASVVSSRRASDASYPDSKASQTELFSFDTGSYDVGTAESDDEGEEGDGEVDERVSPGEATATPTKAKAQVAGVVAVTLAGLASYLVSLVGTIAGAFSAAVPSTAALTMLGVASGVLVLLAPWIWLSEWRLIHLREMRTRVDTLQREAQHLQRQLELLQMEEEALRQDEELLRESNARLEERVGEENTGNVHDLVAQVQENQQVMRQMKENLRQVVLQDVIRQVLRSDLHRNDRINKYEATVLATRLTLALGAHGIVFDAERFHRAVGLSPSLGGVIRTVRRLLPDEHGRVSSFYDRPDSRDDDEETWDDGGGGGEDVYDMFHVPVDREFHRRCSDATLSPEYLLERRAHTPLVSLCSSLDAR